VIVNRGLIAVAIGAIMVAPGWSGLLDGPWASRLGWLGTALIIGGSYLQHRYSKPYMKTFSEADWKAIENREFELVIPNLLHGKGTNCQIQTFLRNETGFEAVGCDEHHDENRRAVVMKAAMRFSGKVVIV
jgi:hypothetical protein